MSRIELSLAVSMASHVCGSPPSPTQIALSRPVWAWPGLL